MLSYVLNTSMNSYISLRSKYMNETRFLIVFYLFRTTATTTTTHAPSKTYRIFENSDRSLSEAPR